MYKQVAEAFVPVSCAERIAEKICARSGAFCCSISVTGADTLLDFGDARAIVRPTDEGLHFRVEATDTVTFYGIRTLLQGNISVIMTFPAEVVEWHRAGSETFGAMQGRLQDPPPPPRPSHQADSHQDHRRPPGCGAHS